jgi:hypothetical protein
MRGRNIFQSWNYINNAAPITPAEHHWAFDFPTNAAPGKWRFQALYNGQTYETFFNVNAPHCYRDASLRSA